MSEEQYVQHKSGQGDKWHVNGDAGKTWLITIAPHEGAALPKSEYVLCEPPDTWVDVTNECVFTSVPGGAHCLDLMATGCMSGQFVPFMRHYRLQKVQLYGYPLGNPRWAFIVERKNP